MANPTNSRRKRPPATPPKAAATPRTREKSAAAGARKPAVESSNGRQKPPAAPGTAKPKLVRDSFTIPKVEYSVLEELKLRAANLTRPAKKSELLRAGIAALAAMTDRAFLQALEGVPSLKTGRPKGPEPEPTQG